MIFLVKNSIYQIYFSAITDIENRFIFKQRLLSMHLKGFINNTVENSGILNPKKLFNSVKSSQKSTWNQQAIGFDLNS